MTGADLSDDVLLREFENLTLPPTAFHHPQHVRAAWLFIRRDGMPEALTTFSRAVRRFAAAHDASGLFHVTVTWAYLLLIHQRQHQCGAGDWTAFAARNQDLLCWKPSILDRSYSPETLWSDEARSCFVWPDLAAREPADGVLNSTRARADGSPAASGPGADA